MEGFDPQSQKPLSESERETLLVRMLYNEQARLRTQIEELRAKQQQKGDGKSEEKQDGDEGDKKDDGKKESEEHKKPPMKERVRAWTHEHRLGTTFILAGFVAFLIAAVLVWHYLESYENTDDAFVAGHVDPISARISGRVIAVYVENTYRVKKGEVLVQLDPSTYQVGLEQSRADLAQALAGVQAQVPNVPITRTSQNTAASNADLAVESAEANLAAAQQRYRSALSDLVEAKANAANAAREEQRYKLLVAKQEVSRELYDQRATASEADAALVASRQQTAEAAQKDVSSAQAEVNEARLRAAEAKHNMSRQIAVQQQTLAMRNANAQAAQANVDKALLDLHYTKIYAPADGIIGDKSVQLGTQVSPGEEMFALTELNDIWVTANFKETEIKRMRPGQAVSIHVDALGQTFDGYVEALPGGSGAVYSLLPPENATGNYVKVVQRLPVRIRFKAGQQGLDRLAPGMSVEPKVWIN